MGRRVQFGRLSQHLLDRAATPDEVAEWTRQIGLGRSESWVTAQIAGSTEYAEVIT